MRGRIINEILDILNGEFTEEEVYQALKQMYPAKVPGLDGMLGLFYQKMWSIVKEDVVKIALDVLKQ